MIRSICILVLVSCYLTVLTACGQKGDLYLPEIPPAPNVQSPSAESAQVETNTQQYDATENEQAPQKKMQQNPDLPTSMSNQ